MKAKLNTIDLFSGRMKILDACCGSRMFWFDKEHKDTLYMDKRVLSETLCDGRLLEINPDIEGDFRDMPFPDNSFYMVVFDPPHLRWAGVNSIMRAKYGQLEADWKKDIEKGFAECFRVLKPNGTLIFKWSEAQISIKEVLGLTKQKPLFGNQRGKTHWIVFMKGDSQ